MSSYQSGDLNHATRMILALVAYRGGLGKVNSLSSQFYAMFTLRNRKCLVMCVEPFVQSLSVESSRTLDELFKYSVP